MRKETSFSSTPLSEDDFIEKYKVTNVNPLTMQPHTIKVSDGRNELEQLIISNQMIALDAIMKLSASMACAGIKLPHVERDVISALSVDARNGITGLIEQGTK